MGLSRLSTREKWLLAIALVLGLGYVVYAYVYTPITTHHAAVAKELEDVNFEMQKGLAALKRIPKVEQEFREKLAALESFEVLIPDEDKLPYLLKDLEDIAGRGNVKIYSLSLGKPAPVGDYLEIELKLTLEGEYNDILAFFANVEAMPRLINVTGFSIGGFSAATVEGSKAPLKVDVMMTTIVRPKNGGEKRDEQ